MSIKPKPEASLNPRAQLALDFCVADCLATTPRLIQLGSHAVPYQLKRSQRRTISFLIDSRGLVVAAPNSVLHKDIEAALLSKQRWILNKLKERQARHSLLEPSPWQHGSSLPYLGRNITIHLGSGTPISRLQLGIFASETTLLLPLSLDASQTQIKQALQTWLQTEAQRLYRERLPAFEARLQIKVKQLRLSNARTRWGSATSDGNIRLHWRLIHFDLDVIDYVIAHELAHLKEMNHSAKFWQIVATLLPNFQTARTALRQASLQALPAI